jgi:hypothetical protein
VTSSHGLYPFEGDIWVHSHRAYSRQEWLAILGLKVLRRKRARADVNDIALQRSEYRNLVATAALGTRDVLVESLVGDFYELVRDERCWQSGLTTQESGEKKCRYLPSRAYPTLIIGDEANDSSIIWRQQRSLIDFSLVG